MSNKSLIISKINEISSLSNAYISKRLKEERIPVLRNHLPLFLILANNSNVMTFRRLVEEWSISKSSLSDIIIKYEALGLVRKCACDQDKRSIYIRLTSEAAPIVESIKGILEELSGSVLSSFNDKEQTEFENHIDRAYQKIKNMS